MVTNTGNTSSTDGKYVELYKKYRPKSWDEVIGQDEVVADLRNAVADNRLPTAYLFSGPMGTGKTTAAIILAKAINCENPDGKGNPCNHCETCRSIDDKTCIGFHYISAANNGGVNEVRQFMDLARRSAPIRRPVWVIDEVQRLSKEGFDSLLIPLEDTGLPSLFIFCTTELNRISPTVISRLQNRRFSLVPSDKIKGLCRSILDDEGFTEVSNDEYRAIAKSNADLGWDERRKVYSESVLNKAVRMAGVTSDGGSVRQTLSKLEEVLNGSTGKTDYDSLIAMAVFAKNNPLLAMSYVSKAIADGDDPRLLTEGLVDSSRELMNLLAKKESDVDPAKMKRYKSARQIGARKLLYVFRRLGMAQRDQLTSDDARLYLELALVDIAEILRGNESAMMGSILY